jgi:hypothetical protein
MFIHHLHQRPINLNRGALMIAVKYDRWMAHPFISSCLIVDASLTLFYKSKHYYGPNASSATVLYNQPVNIRGMTSDMKDHGGEKIY